MSNGWGAYVDIFSEVWKSYIYVGVIRLSLVVEKSFFDRFTCAYI